MKKRIASILTIISLSFSLFAFSALPISSPSTVSAVEPAFSLDPCQTPDAGTGNGAPFIELCENTDASRTGGVIRNVIVAILVIAAIIALFYLLWGGVKWILSGGDKAKVDTARSTIIAAIVGLIITLLAYFILSVVLNLFGIGFDNLEVPNLTGNSTACPEGQERQFIEQANRYECVNI